MNPRTGATRPRGRARPGGLVLSARPRAMDSLSEPQSANTNLDELSCRITNSQTCIPADVRGSDRRDCVSQCGFGPGRRLRREDKRQLELAESWTPIGGPPGAGDDAYIGSYPSGAATTATVMLTQNQQANTVGHGQVGTLNLGNFNLTTNALYFGFNGGTGIGR
jgi:hypothetical protein